jgi:hypothetical protein
MKIVISNVAFDYNIGCKLLKAKYKDVPFGNLDDIWDDIVPITFKEIATQITNIEQRRVAIGCIGLEEIAREVNPTLVKKETLSKQTTWVTPEGEMVQHKFKDTYELFKVEGKKWSEGTDRNWGANDVYFLRFKDTSTDREYMLWVDAESVARTNNKNQGWFSSSQREHITPIQAIAWTFQTNVPVGKIEKIVRQGDCIMIKRTGNDLLDTPRHLTEEEYRELLVAES